MFINTLVKFAKCECVGGESDKDKLPSSRSPEGTGVNWVDVNVKVSSMD